MGCCKNDHPEVRDEGYEAAPSGLLGQNSPAGSPSRFFTQAGLFFRATGCDSRLQPGDSTHRPQLP